MHAHVSLQLLLLCTPCRLLIVTLEQALLTEEADIVELLDLPPASHLDGCLALHASLVAGQVDYPEGHQEGEEGAEDHGEDHEAGERLPAEALVAEPG